MQQNEEIDCWLDATCRVGNDVVVASHEQTPEVKMIYDGTLAMMIISMIIMIGFFVLAARAQTKTPVIMFTIGCSSFLFLFIGVIVFGVGLPVRLNVSGFSGNSVNVTRIPIIMRNNTNATTGFITSNATTTGALTTGAVATDISGATTARQLPSTTSNLHDTTTAAAATTTTVAATNK